MLFGKSNHSHASSGSSERFTPEPHVVSVVQDTDTALLDVRSERYFTLNEVGTRIWELLAEGASLSTAAHRAGFADADALHVYRSFFGFLYGHVLNELQELVDNPEETDDLLRLGLHRLPIREFPRLRALAPVLASYDGHAELESGLDILLTGLQTQLHPVHDGTNP